jgi:hypothetical protein
MEIPWPKWMEFVVLGITSVLCVVTLWLISHFQKKPED